jgi:hypothetical protein
VLDMKDRIYFTIKKQGVSLVKYILFLGILFSATACHAYTEISWWTITVGEDRVVEFLSEDHRPYCGNNCYSFVVVGRPDEIFISTLRHDTISRLRRGEVQMNHSPKIYVLNLKSNMINLMELDRFLQLEMVFEDLMGATLLGMNMWLRFKE